MLKKLKSLFIEDDGSPEASKAKPKTQGQAKDTSTAKEDPALDIEVPSNPVNPTAKPDRKFVDVLLKAIEANNLEGFDYLEFKQSLQSLSKMDMDEKTRYQSAMAMAKTMGATPTNLIKSAKHYLAILKKEESKFLDAVKNQRSRQITDREKNLKSQANLIKEKEQKILQLQKEIEAHKKELEQSKGQINQAAAKVAATRDGFIAAYNSVVGQIVSDVEKMESHLK